MWVYSTYSYYLGATNNSLLKGMVTIPSEVIGKNVVGIDYSAFEGATDLTGIVIPESVWYIQGRAFTGCSNLTDVVVESPWPAVIYRSNAFDDDTYANATLWVPEGSIDIYRDSMWGYFEHIKEGVPTGINTPNASPQAADSYYTIGGQRTQKPVQKGIYITRGRKVIAR